MCSEKELSSNFFIFSNADHFLTFFQRGITNRQVVTTICISHFGIYLIYTWNTHLRISRYTLFSINFCTYNFLLFNVVYTYSFAFPYIYRDILSFYIFTSIHRDLTYVFISCCDLDQCASLFAYIIANLWNLCLLPSWISRLLLYIFFMTLFHQRDCAIPWAFSLYITEIEPAGLC